MKVIQKYCSEGTKESTVIGKTKLRFVLYEILPVAIKRSKDDISRAILSPESSSTSRMDNIRFSDVPKLVAIVCILQNGQVHMKNIIDIYFSSKVISTSHIDR